MLLVHPLRDIERALTQQPGAVVVSDSWTAFREAQLTPVRAQQRQPILQTDPGGCHCGANLGTEGVRARSSVALEQGLPASTARNVASQIGCAHVPPRVPSGHDVG